MTTVAVAPARTAHGLGKHYRGAWALRDLDLSLPAGSVTALVGHNGAGKTTLLRLLAGLVTPTMGTIEDLGTVAYVAQDKPLFGSWRVREMLELGARIHLRWDEDLATRWLADLGVPLDRTCAKLSGGQRAQVALGLALAARPDVLLLDEPMASLDPLARTDLTRALLGAVAQTGVTVLLSTHQTADLPSLADRVLLLAAGRGVLAGDVDDLLAAHCVLEGPEGGLPMRADAVLAVESDGRRVRATVRTAELPEALHACWSIRPATLEELLLDQLRASR